jgi:hypothetical protein
MLISNDKERSRVNLIRAAHLVLSLFARLFSMSTPFVSSNINPCVRRTTGKVQTVDFFILNTVCEFCSQYIYIFN